MDISRELAIQVLKYLNQHKDFYFPFLVMNKEYTEKDNDFVEIEPEEWELMAEDKNYRTFQLWENLQNLDGSTTKLLAEGFINHITKKSLENYIEKLIKNYKRGWKDNLWESKNTEEYGFNEFLGGKIDAYEDCLRIIKERSII